MPFYYLLVSVAIATSFAQDACLHFSPSERSAITSTCGAAVDYSFFLSSSSTLSSLEKAARTALGNNEFQLVSSECLINYKKLVCGSIYLKCQPSVNLSDVLTFNNKLYPPSISSSGLSIPFTRPCMQVSRHSWRNRFNFLAYIRLRERWKTSLS